MMMPLPLNIRNQTYSNQNYFLKLSTKKKKRAYFLHSNRLQYGCIIIHFYYYIVETEQPQPRGRYIYRK